MRSDKLMRLTEVARLYYEQDKTQCEVAKLLGVSRPLISRMLSEAKALGIVEIRIHPPDGQDEQRLLARARAALGLKGGSLVPNHGSDTEINRSVAAAALQFLHSLGGVRLGLGWGHIIGILVSLLDERAPIHGINQHVCPMIGNSGISIRNYHSNENVRIFAQQTQSEPHYLFTPAFCASAEELELTRRTAHYQAVAAEWELLDVALVNIGNYPSAPDFASSARFGNKLSEGHAIGRMLAYYFNLSGEIIASDTDYTIQISLDLLRKCPHVVGLCSSTTTPKTLAGALRTGLITDVIATGSLMKQTLAVLNL